MHFTLAMCFITSSNASLGRLHAPSCSKVHTALLPAYSHHAVLIATVPIAIKPRALNFVSIKMLDCFGLQHCQHIHASICCKHDVLPSSLGLICLFTMQLTKADFPLPSLSPKLIAIGKQVNSGRGFHLVRYLFLDIVLCTAALIWDS